MKSLKLYPERREELQDLYSQGAFVNFCNGYLCPFNNDGICVAPRVDCSDSKELDHDLNILYDISDSLDEDEVNFAFEAWRDLMIERYGE